MDTLNAAASATSLPTADPALPAAWQPALDHSHYLRQLLAARPELIPILASTWERPLKEADLADWIAAAAPLDEGAKSWSVMNARIA